MKVQLHQKLNSKRFAMIGISDESQSTVADYHKGSSNAYPISLLDEQGLMKKFFPGGAVPVTILVDGWGWLIAMRRGGAPWNRKPYEDLIRYLISLAPTQEQLKEKAPAPKVSFPESVKVSVGQSFLLKFSLNWVGESDKYARIALRLPKEKGLKQLGVTTTGIHSTQRSNRRQYILRLKALKQGSYKLNPLLLNYWIKDYDQHFQVKVGSMTIEVKAARGFQRGAQNPTWPLYAIGASVLLLFLLVFLIQRQKQSDAPVDPEEEQKEQQRQKLTALIANLRDAHHGTDPKEQIEQLYQIYKQILDKIPENVSKLRDDIKYGGHNFPTDQRRQLIDQLTQDLNPKFPEEARLVRNI